MNEQSVTATRQHSNESAGQNSGKTLNLSHYNVMLMLKDTIFWGVV